MKTEEEILRDYQDMITSTFQSRGTMAGVQRDFDHFVYSSIPCGIESRFYVRGVPCKYKFWGRLGYWFLKKAGYELVWPKETK